MSLDMQQSQPERDGRLRLIENLEAMAASIKAKLEKKGPRPLFIEFSGTPKSGKTTVATGLDLFFRRNAFSVEKVYERASTCPIGNKQHMFFNIWTACATLNAMLTAIDKDVDVVIIDRGIYDAIIWMNFLQIIGRLAPEEFSVIRNFLLLPRWREVMDVVFVMIVDPDKAIEREHKHLLTEKSGSIMNKNTLSKFNRSLQETSEDIKGLFKKVVTIDTTKSDDIVRTSEKVVNSTLVSLIELMTDKIFVVSHDYLAGALSGMPNVYTPLTHAKIADFEAAIIKNGTEKDREDVEDDDVWIQPIICTILTWNGQVLLLKKKERHSHMRFHGKYMIWVGGHLEAVDIKSAEGAFLGCLKRELAEELLLTTPISAQSLGILWDRSNAKSRRHIGFVYAIDIPTTDIADALKNQKEFYKSRGKSLSCTFIAPGEAIQHQSNMEPWTKAILKGRFGIELREDSQKSFWDDV
jgi:predicted NUDIX family phosphoesterase/thymidylate kinase